MTPFAYRRADSVADALRHGGEAGAAFLAGGTELLNWLRIGIAAPARVVDISRLAGLDAVSPAGEGLSIGALARLADVAAHPAVADRFPVLAQAVLQAASPQIRNLATLGGNLAQATRCAYFRSEDAVPCNKRVAGSGCAARHGLNDRHAIFGWTDACVATQPSDPAVALAALDAVVVTSHPAGGRRIPVAGFHAMPADAPAAHNVLCHGELVTAIELPTAAPRSLYLKVRGRASFEFALVSVAVVLADRESGFRGVRIALGGVAPRPWRLYGVEAALAGLDPAADDVDAAVERGFADARPLAMNGYKIPLARRLVTRALAEAAALP